MNVPVCIKCAATYGTGIPSMYTGMPFTGIVTTRYIWDRYLSIYNIYTFVYIY